VDKDPVNDGWKDSRLRYMDMICGTFRPVKILQAFNQYFHDSYEKGPKVDNY
jgi:hypothetical protein